jgi:hypothetical protein
MMAAAMLRPTIYVPSRLARLLIPLVSSQGKVMAPGSKDLPWRLRRKVCCRA